MKKAELETQLQYRLELLNNQIAAWNVFKVGQRNGFNYLDLYINGSHSKSVFVGKRSEVNEHLYTVLEVLNLKK